MRLTRWGRLLNAVIALGFAYVTANSLARRQWLSGGLELLGAAVFAYPAFAGRSPLAGATHVPRWLGRVEPPRDRPGPPAAG
jgi:hypothetical protein